jgi:hypothetical protein
MFIVIIITEWAGKGEEVVQELVGKYQPDLIQKEQVDRTPLSPRGGGRRNTML